MRSRGSSLPRARWRSRAAAPPPSPIRGRGGARDRQRARASPRHCRETPASADRARSRCAGITLLSIAGRARGAPADDRGAWRGCEPPPSPYCRSCEALRQTVTPWPRADNLRGRTLSRADAEASGCQAKWPDRLPQPPFEPAGGAGSHVHPGSGLQEGPKNEETFTPDRMSSGEFRLNHPPTFASGNRSKTR